MIAAPTRQHGVVIRISESDYRRRAWQRVACLGVLEVLLWLAVGLSRTIVRRQLGPWLDHGVVGLGNGRGIARQAAMVQICCGGLVLLVEPSVLASTLSFGGPCNPARCDDWIDCCTVDQGISPRDNISHSCMPMTRSSPPHFTLKLRAGEHSWTLVGGYKLAGTALPLTQVVADFDCLKVVNDCHQQ